MSSPMRLCSRIAPRVWLRATSACRLGSRSRNARRSASNSEASLSTKSSTGAMAAVGSVADDVIAWNCDSILSTWARLSWKIAWPTSSAAARCMSVCFFSSANSTMIWRCAASTSFSSATTSLAAGAGVLAATLGATAEPAFLPQPARPRPATSAAMETRTK